MEGLPDFQNLEIMSVCTHEQSIWRSSKMYFDYFFDSSLVLPWGLLMENI